MAVLRHLLTILGASSIITGCNKDDKSIASSDSAYDKVLECYHSASFVLSYERANPSTPNNEATYKLESDKWKDRLDETAPRVGKSKADVLADVYAGIQQQDFADADATKRQFRTAMRCNEITESDLMFDFGGK